MEPIPQQEQQQPKQNLVRVGVTVQGRGMRPTGKCSRVGMNVYGGFLKPETIDRIFDMLVGFSSIGATVTAGPGGCSSGLVPEPLAESIAKRLRDLANDPDNFQEKSSHKYKSGVIDAMGQISMRASQG